MKIKEYKKEPFDLQLFVLLLAKKIWMIILGGIIGGALFGGIYYLSNITFGPADTYEMVSESYLEYAYDENGEQYIIFNQVTWESMIYADDFISSIASKTGLDREMIKESISATLLSDTRILTTTVVGSDKKTVEQINEALLDSLRNFGENQRELIEVRSMLKPEQATIQDQDIRVLNATILGVIIGLLLSMFLVILYIIWDDRIHHAGIFEARYEIPMLGVYGSELYEENCLHIFDEEKEYIAVFADDVKAAELKFGEESFSKTIINPYLNPSNIQELDSDYAYILFVSAKKHNSKVIEATFSLFEKYHCEIEAAVLTDVDERMLKWYFFPGKKWIKKHLK